MSENTLKHIEHLASTIGARGSTTPKEKEAHEYCKQTLEGLGYETHWEEFYSPVSGWMPYTIALSLIIFAALIFYGIGQTQNFSTGAIAASVIGLFTAISFFLEMTHRDNPLVWLMPAEKSQNVWAVAKAKHESKRRIVITGHVDTHRTALAMQTPALWQVFQILTTLAAIAVVALTILFVIGIFSPDPLLRTIALGVAVIPLIGLIFTAQPEFTPYVKGGNDNATGAAAVLGLAERLKKEPLANTAVYLINTGCEEVGCYGARDWIKRHAGELPNADYLVLDNIGGKNSDVNYVVSETVLLPFKSDSRLIGMAEQVAKENPDLKATPFNYKGLYSEMSICARYGQKVLGLLSFDPKTKMPPLFHTVRDDFNNVDPDILDKSERLAWGIMQKIDQA
jgi:hypothetical protein